MFWRKRCQIPSGVIEGNPRFRSHRVSGVNRENGQVGQGQCTGSGWPWAGDLDIRQGSANGNHLDTNETSRSLVVKELGLQVSAACRHSNGRGGCH
ncbi:hypothetical protein BIW11_10254 [Tropilaelaps mercedesae]|uniref:Uncharacterized protein n=1 Tax=Tropilaelaps mercedesae TaxID=418985 RepID=A0A1V9XGI1_9ACAR|nr:hypothetical protein BIW11_10254 [Tropilaelaps mercedesae]